MEARPENLLDRRSFLGLAAAAGASVVVGSMLAGCAGEQPRTEQAASTSEPAAPAATEPATTEAPATEAAPTPVTGKTLVAVFSWSGNTLQVAERIRELTDADFYRIEPAVPYTTNYNEVLDVAQREQSDNTIPALAQGIDNWSEYDTVYLGYPVWWYHIPQVVKGFIQQYDLAGKTVHPFCTSGGSSISGTLNDIRAVCPSVQLTDGLTLDGDTVASSMSRVDAWVGEKGVR